MIDQDFKINSKQTEKSIQTLTIYGFLHSQHLFILKILIESVCIVRFARPMFIKVSELYKKKYKIVFTHKIVSFAICPDNSV